MWDVGVPHNNGKHCIHCSLDIWRQKNLHGGKPNWTHRKNRLKRMSKIYTVMF